MSPADAPVLRVISASLSLFPGSVMEALLAMRGQVCAFNSAHGVCSAFLYSSGWFFQWHEGSVEGVGKLLEIAKGDPHQGHMRVLHRSVGPATLTETLQIVTTHGNEKPTDVARRLFRLTQSQAIEVQAQPDEIWLQLVAPRGPARPGMPETSLVQRHVVAVTSANSGAVDLVRAIGQRTGARATYQRFATAEPRSSDVGAVYVDLPGPFQVMRLHALSRRSLSHPTVRLLLRDVHCVLLLLGEGANSSRSLVADVGGLLRGLAVRPSLRLSASTPDGLARARESLNACSNDITEVSSTSLWQAAPQELFDSLLGAAHARQARAECISA